VVNATLRPLTPGEESRYPLYKRLDGPQGRRGRVRKISPPLGFDPRTVQPVGSRNIDYANPVTLNASTLRRTRQYSTSVHTHTYLLQLAVYGRPGLKYFVSVLSVIAGVNARCMKARSDCLAPCSISHTCLRNSYYEPLQTRYSDSLLAGRSEVRIPVEARFSAPVQTGPGAYPASYIMSTGSLTRG
jgi:hypothetical protein